MTPVLQVENLSLHFGAVTAATDMSVTVQPGEFIGIIGPNGAGKTTFLNLVTGYLQPAAGSVAVLGQPIAGLSPRQVTNLGVGRSFQIPQLFLTMTARDNVLVALATAAGDSTDFWYQLHRRDRIEEADRLLEQMGLRTEATRLASELPAGGRKLLDIAVALALGPKFLLMDEPTSGVAMEDKFDVMDTLVAALQQAGVTAMFVEHDMDVVRRYASRVLVLSHGRFIADGDPETILNDPDIRRAVAGWS